MTFSPNPEPLTDEAADFYALVAGEHGITDKARLLILRAACEALQRLRQAQGILEKDGIVTTDRFGQQKQHPATLVERDARNALFKALGALGLDPEPRVDIDASFEEELSRDH